MKNGTMFAQLLKYKEQDFFEKYPYFSIYTPDGKESKYQIFVAGVVEDTAVNYQFAFQSDEEFLNYIRDDQRNITVYAECGNRRSISDCDTFYLYKCC